MAAPTPTQPPAGTVAPHKVNVPSLRKRTNRDGKARWQVRWALDETGVYHARTFATKTAADRFVRGLHNAVDEGRRFGVDTGEPHVDSPAAETPTVGELAAAYLRERWSGWQPRTRKSAAESLARIVRIARRSDEGQPEGFNDAWIANRYLHPDADPGGYDADDRARAAHLEEFSYRFDEITERTNLHLLFEELGRCIDGTRLAAETARRHRKTARSLYRYAAELGVIEPVTWPTTNGSKADRTERVNLDALPDFAAVLAAIDAYGAIDHFQATPAANRHTAMLIGLYLGLRPSEICALQKDDLNLPDDGGWGTCVVARTLSGTGDQQRWADERDAGHAAPKTRGRSVPIPPPLVAHLKAWIDQPPTDANRDTDLVVCNRRGGALEARHITGPLRDACTEAGLGRVTAYTLRHLSVRTCLGAGMSLAETAARHGHDVDTMLRFYTGTVLGETERGNELLDAFYESL